MSGVVIWVSQKEGRHPKFTQVGGGGIGIRSQLFITPKPEAPSWAFETTTAVALKCEVRESRWGSLCEPPPHLSAPLPAKTPTRAPRKPPRLWAQQAWAALSGLRPALGQGGEAPRCQSWEATRCEKSPWQPRITILGSGGHPAAPPIHAAGRVGTAVETLPLLRANAPGWHSSLLGPPATHHGVPEIHGECDGVLEWPLFLKKNRSPCVTPRVSGPATHFEALPGGDGVARIRPRASSQPRSKWALTGPLSGVRAHR